LSFCFTHDRVSFAGATNTNNSNEAYTSFDSGVNAFEVITVHVRSLEFIILLNANKKICRDLSFQKKRLICNIIALAAMQQSR
jgi:hypothetical protein